jgi:hypothetical protein
VVAVTVVEAAEAAEAEQHVKLQLSLRPKTVLS